jgi:hypothetical protein
MGVERRRLSGLSGRIIVAVVFAALGVLTGYTAANLHSSKTHDSRTMTTGRTTIVEPIDCEPPACVQFPGPYFPPVSSNVIPIPLAAPEPFIADGLTAK